jgi:hypothetical protein
MVESEAPRPGCAICPDSEHRTPAQILDHFRVMHPGIYGDGPDRWPDGSLVIVDESLSPDDFGGATS